MAEEHGSIGKLAESLRVEPGRKVDLGRDFDPASTPDFVGKEESQELLRRGIELLTDLQARLAAQDTYGLLVVVQGIDASGKDGTIKHVMSGVNPQGVAVHSFKSPSAQELDHDYLWRCAQHLPARGEIAIFNRSHYEEVLVVRVHTEYLTGQKLPEESKGRDIWKRRYREINDWERYLTDNGFRVVKLFLNLSKEEQRRRFLDRIDQPDKRWKFSLGDVRERERWDAYQEAFSAMLSATSTTWAPWHVIPADHKWFTRVAAAAVIIDALTDIDPRYPVLDEEAQRSLMQARAELAAEADPEEAPEPSAEASQPPAAAGAGANAGKKRKGDGKVAKQRKGPKGKKAGKERKRGKRGK